MKISKVALTSLTILVGLFTLKNKKNGSLPRTHSQTDVSQELSHNDQSIGRFLLSHKAIQKTFLRTINDCNDANVRKLEGFSVPMILKIGGKETLIDIPFMKEFVEHNLKQCMNEYYEDIVFHSLEIHDNNGKGRGRRATATGICKGSRDCPPKPEFTFPQRKGYKDEKDPLTCLLQQMQDSDDFEAPQFTYVLNASREEKKNVYKAIFEQDIVDGWSDVSSMSLSSPGEQAISGQRYTCTTSKEECEIQRDAISSVLRKIDVDFDESNHECSWQGVLCDENNIITQIWIENHSNTKKRFPEEFLHLTELTTLVLRNNALTGPLPVELNKLEKLKMLSFEFNEMTGTIPSAFGLLQHLTGLKLNNNDFINGIPSEIGKAESLEILDMSRNPGLGGTIPEHLGLLKNLKTLILYKSNVSGQIPLGMSSLSNLQEILFGDNILNGNINVLSQLTKLKVIDIANNHFTGSIPKDIAAVVGLNVLNAYNNEFDAQIDASIGSLSSLTNLILGKNNLHGPIPTNIGLLSKLEIFDVGENHLTGQVPTELGNLSNLEAINLYDNDLSGSTDFLCNSAITYAVDEDKVDRCP